MAKKKEGLGSAVKKKKRAPGWHGSNKKLSNRERAMLGLSPIEEKKVTREKVPNLKRDKKGNYVNQYGVVITQKQKQRLERNVNKINRMRDKMLKEEAGLSRMSAGKKTGQNLSSLMALNRESDFIVSHRSKSLQRFKTQEQFNTYLRNTQRITSKNYIKERIRAYKRNHITALERAFGEDARDIINKIRNMPQAEYMKMIQQDEFLEIGYIYDPSNKSGKLNVIRAAMKLRMQEEEYDELE